MKIPDSRDHGPPPAAGIAKASPGQESSGKSHWKINRLYELTPSPALGGKVQVKDRGPPAPTKEP